MSGALRLMKNNHLLIALGLVTLGVVSRLIPHQPNLTAIGAIAIFSGVYLPKKFAFAVPILSMLISDMIIGFHSTIGWVYAAFVLVAFLSYQGRSWLRDGKILASPLVSASLFFLVSNFGVWLSGSLYPLTLAGLVDCFIRAVPFFRPTLMGDFAYTTLLYASFQLVQDWRSQRSTTLVWS